MFAPLGAGISMIAAGMLFVSVLGVPTVDRAKVATIIDSCQYQPTQRHAWNPYDCRFWQALPPEEFGLE